MSRPSRSELTRMSLRVSRWAMAASKFGEWHKTLGQFRHHQRRLIIGSIWPADGEIKQGCQALRVRHPISQLSLDGNGLEIGGGFLEQNGTSALAKGTAIIVEVGAQ